MLQKNIDKEKEKNGILGKGISLAKLRPKKKKKKKNRKKYKKGVDKDD